MQENSGAKNILVTRGAEGSFLLCADGSIIKQTPYPVTKAVVDTTGAGDVFRGAFVVSLASKKFTEKKKSISNLPSSIPLTQKEHKEALEFAAAASCLSVQNIGAIPSIPSRDDVIALIEMVRSGNNFCNK